MSTVAPTPKERDDSPHSQRLALYETRLTDGQELIELRRAAGHDVSKLEAFWTQLEREYRALCEQEEVPA